MDEIQKILMILQSIGCKISIQDDKIVFSDKELVNEILLNKIETHKTEIKLRLSNDIQTMSLNLDSGGVGTELKKLLSAMSATYDSFDRYKELDARGYLWCDANKTIAIRWLVGFAKNNGLELTSKSANTLIKKAISNYKKSLIS